MKLSPMLYDVVRLIEDGHNTVDKVMAKTGQTRNAASQVLTVLSGRGVIERRSGVAYIRADFDMAQLEKKNERGPEPGSAPTTTKKVIKDPRTVLQRISSDLIDLAERMMELADSLHKNIITDDEKEEFERLKEVERQMKEYFAGKPKKH